MKKLPNVNIQVFFEDLQVNDNYKSELYYFHITSKKLTLLKITKILIFLFLNFKKTNINLLIPFFSDRFYIYFYFPWSLPDREKLVFNYFRTTLKNTKKKTRRL